MRCAIATCNTDDQSKNFAANTKFFRFPKDSHFCKKWLNACGRSDKVNVLNARVCSLHFGVEHYARNLRNELLNLTPHKRQRLLKPDAIPTHNLPKQKKACKSEEERSDRQLRKQAAELLGTALGNSDSNNGVGVNGGQETTPDEIGGIDTDS